MLYSQENVRDNLRNRAGKRVFYLGQGDTLTPSARDWLQQQKVQILPAREAKPDAYVLPNGAVFPEKPEGFTHLRDNILVPKTHPVIAFRGAMDTLQAQLLLVMAQVQDPLRSQLQQILDLARNILRWEVLQEPAREQSLCMLNEQQLRERSHDPGRYFGQPHFMPEWTDKREVLLLNRLRCDARAAELAAARAFMDAEGQNRREDLVQLLNRMSSMLYILMIQTKAGG